MEKFNETTLIQYSFMLPFEKNFSFSSAQQWMKEMWYTGFYYSIIYVLIIFSLKRLMANSKPYSLNTLLLLWNTALAIFNIIVFSRTCPEFLHTLNNRGIYHSICDSNFLTDDKVSGFWSVAFVLAKLPEFGDTLFIVLRKQPLIFLHWYHHILTLLYSWYALNQVTSSARWFVVMNSFLHSFMYSYYAFKALKIRIPRSISAIITSMQICQMAVGCYVNYKIIEYLFKNISCHVSVANVTWSSIMYFSYLVLFAQFFYLSYIDKSKKHKSL